jgi:8-oxo-dGTP pyrophosphatase MutT (NUDIX family)
MSIRTLSSREIYRNPWMRLREDQIERSNGTHGIYGVVEKDPAAIIIPLEENSLYLVQQYRYTVEAVCMEFPQGGWETAEVDIEELARGELREETGLRAASLTYLGQTWIAYGFCRQPQHVFVATGLTHGETDFDPEEHDLTLHKVSIAEFESMLLSSRIQDNCTIAAWGLYKVWKESQLRLK